MHRVLLPLTVVLYFTASVRVFGAGANSEEVNEALAAGQAAVNLAKIGHYAEAEKALRDLLRNHEKTLGPEHQVIVAAHGELGATLRSEGKFAEAEKELRTVVALDQRLLGEEHADTLSTRSNLAAVLIQEGRLAEAEQELRELLEISTRVLGEEHPDTLRDFFDNLCRAPSMPRGSTSKR